MILLYLCVLACECFYDLPINNTGNLGHKPIPHKVDYISSFAWIEDICNNCFEEWQASYVENASLYTTFLLFTKASRSNYTVVNIGDEQGLYKGGFNSSLDTKIIIHGWLDNGTNYFAEDVRHAYLHHIDVNIISVDWSNMSTTIYPLARLAVTPVGHFVAGFVDFLINQVSLKPDSVHLVGHSLGAHIAGVVGEYVTFGNLSRITGLDPASPLFGSDPSGRLDPTDALFVDVIHTTGDYLGFFKPCGDVDFYPNGGTAIQPGCGFDIGFCSHRRAYKYFSESIWSLGFVSTACSSWSDYKEGLCKNNQTTIMGEHIDFSANGSYYLRTNSTSPFALWNNSLAMEHQSALPLL